MKSIVKAPTNKDETKLEIENRKLAKEVAKEGIVLLKNDNALPLENKTISLFGGGARRTITGGTGSGDMHERYSVSIEQGLLDAGFSIDSTHWLNRYDAYYEKKYGEWKAHIEDLVKDIDNPMEALGLKKQHEFLYPTGMQIKEEELKNLQTETAIYVIARQAGEGYDRRLESGDYYLDQTEKDNLMLLTEHYDNVIVVINSGAPIDVSFFETAGISAVLFYAQAGEEGGHALADIISGNVSPSGKLTNTWALRYEDYPSAGKYSHESNPYEQDYTEGIYVGYRYFDTFGVKPKYSFGFGLSYTNFLIKQQKISIKGEKVKQVLDVKNVGDFEGKEVVQTYVTLPFSEQGTEYQRLVAFAKTDVLKPGESVSITLTFSIKELTQYDERHAAFQLLGGDYVVRTGNSSHQTTPVVILNQKETVTIEQCKNINAPNKVIDEILPPKRANEDLTSINRIEIDQEFLPLIHVYENECEPTPPINDLVHNMSDEELATLVVGGGVTGQRIVNVLGASGSTTSTLYEKYEIPNIIMSDGPAGLNITPELVQLPNGEVKSTQLYEQYNFGAFRTFMESRLGNSEDGQMHYQYATAWPASVLLAQTWNQHLVERVGEKTGEEMEKFGVTIWLAPGMNIQRNPLGGRSFEYYSEDPLLSGKMAASITNGVQKNVGKGTSIKHFCANNHEEFRHESSSNLNERALREVYLRGFEIAVKESNPMTVMASYNKINGIYNTNNLDLLTNVLRKEWHYDGLVITDWEAVEEGRGDIMKAHHVQCDVIMPGTKDQVAQLTQGIKKGLVNRYDVERSVRRLLSIIDKNTVLNFNSK